MQRRIKIITRQFVALIVLAAACAPALADLRVQVEESVNGAVPAPVTHWFGQNRTMRDDGSRYIITSLRDETTTIVNRETQSYQVVPLNLRPDSEIPAVTVTRTDDTRMIGDWPVRRYRLGGPATRELTIDIWITQDLKVDVSAFRNLMIKLGNRPGSEWLKAYEKIEGFPILQEVELTRPGIRLRSQSRVVSLKEVTPESNNIYEPPEYYQRMP